MVGCGRHDHAQADGPLRLRRLRRAAGRQREERPTSARTRPTPRGSSRPASRGSSSTSARRRSSVSTARMTPARTSTRPSRAATNFIKNSDIDFWAAGVVQNIENAAMDLYVIYRHAEGDTTNSNGDKLEPRRLRHGHLRRSHPVLICAAPDDRKRWERAAANQRLFPIFTPAQGKDRAQSSPTE